MRKLLYGFLLFLALPAFARAQNDTREFNGYQWYDDHIRFEYPLTLADDAVARFYPQSTQTDVPTGPLPERIEITFERYAESTGWQPTGGSITIAPLDTFPTGNQPAALLLNDFRDVMTVPNFETAAAAGIPAFSQLTTPQVLTAQVIQLNFQSGSGVRFLTVGAHDVGEITNGMLFYNYQGITDDGSYFVSAVFPVSTPVLPDESASMDAAAYESFVARYQDYVAETQAALNALSPAAFSPDLAVLDAIIESLHIATPDASLLTAETGGSVDAAGMAFQYDPALAYRVELDTILAVTGTAAADTMYRVSPSIHEFTLVGYPVTGHYHVPQVYIMPVDEFPEPDQRYGEALAGLRALLVEQPDLTNWQETATDSLPMLPLINAGQIIVARPQYLAFEDGAGVRYVTYYAQDASPLLANDLFYTFVGLSSDAQHVIAARFPLYVDFLPAEIDFATLDYESFIANHDAYMTDITNQTNNLTSAGFTPTLDTLDGLITSVRIR